MDVNGFKNAVKSLSHYHRITEEKMDEDQIFDKSALSKLYIDLQPNNGVLDYINQNKTTVLIGKKGTGKSTIFAVAQRDIRKEKRKISLYVNAKTVFTSSASSRDSISLDNRSLFSQDEIFSMSLIEQMIRAMKDSFYEELQLEEYGLFDKIKNNFRDKKIDRIFKEITELIDNPAYKTLNKVYVNDEETNESKELVETIKADLNAINPNVNAEKGKKDTLSKSVMRENTLGSTFSITDIVKKFIELKEACKRDSVIIFIDDFSELLEPARRLFVETIINPFYDIGTDHIHLKISAYPNKTTPLKFVKDKFTQKNIDLFEIYGANSNIPMTEKKGIAYTEKIIRNRIDVFCQSDIVDYFDTRNNQMEEFYKTLYRTCMCIPRTLGGILDMCYMKYVSYNKKLTISNIEDCAKDYYETFTEKYFNKTKNTLSENFDDIIDVFAQDKLLKDIYKLCQKNKFDLAGVDNQYFNDLSEAYTSHFYVSLEKAEFLNTLEFNGFVHRITKIAGKGRTVETIVNPDNLLYTLDFGLCQKYKILYGRPEGKDTKYYQQRIFNFDDIILQSLSDNKKIVCNECKSEYPIEKLESISEYGMLCMKCMKGKCTVLIDPKTMEEAKKLTKSSVFNEQEIDILCAMYNIKKIQNEEWSFAKTISLSTDYNSSSIAWCCRKLDEGGHVLRRQGYQLMKYSLSERGYKYVETILMKD